MKSKSLTADAKDREHEAVESEHNEPRVTSAPSLGEIRQRAYRLDLERGCVNGWDQDEWLQAERELMEKYEAR
jgi:hypothetical protein